MDYLEYDDSALEVVLPVSSPMRLPPHHHIP
jgi:hypothetical protein